MQEVLLRSLISHNHFKIATEVKVQHKALSIGHMSSVSVDDVFTVTSIKEKRTAGTLILEGISVSDGGNIRFEPKDILSIDGMTPERFAENYMIATDGSEIKITGARRGRRPKNWTGN